MCLQDGIDESFLGYNRQKIERGLTKMTEKIPVEEGRYPPIMTREMPHLGHAKHLCHLVEHRGIDINEYKPLVKNAKFLCKKCGRVAANEENLCEPIKL